MKYTQETNMSEVKSEEERIPSIAVNVKVLSIYLYPLAMSKYESI